MIMQHILSQLEDIEYLRSRGKTRQADMLKQALIAYLRARRDWHNNI